MSLDLFHREYGAGHALTILHGLFGAGGNWHTLSKKAFAPVRRVVVPDLRNHGLSRHDSTFDYEVMADDVIRLWDRLGLRSSDLLGHSMGGKVAMQIALEWPQEVSRLVVVDIAPRPYVSRHDDVIRAFRQIDPAAASSRSDVDRAMAKHVADPGVRRFLLKNLRRTKGGAFEWLLNLDAIEGNYDRISAGPDAFATYEGPSLFIRGAESDYVRDDDSEVIRAYFPSAEIVTIPGAGHWVHADAPDEFASLVVDFLT